jgi:hypothetical protein
MHSTDDIDDGYIGSGKFLWNSIRKYGIENHKKIILEYCENRISLADKESEIINPLLTDKMCMNIRPGGFGGWTVEQQKENNRKSTEKQRKLKNDPLWYSKKQKASKLALIKRLESGEIFDGSISKGFKGKKHSDETRLLMSKSRARLSKDEVSLIREMYRSGSSSKELANKFSVTYHYINNLVSLRRRK